jgi:hypothetical protein
LSLDRSTVGRRMNNNSSIFGTGTHDTTLLLV